MQFEKYLEFLSPTEIRLRGHRIWLEHVLLRYLYLGQTPEQIVEQFPSLTLDDVNIAIEYYRQHRTEAEAYMIAFLEHSTRMEIEQDRNPPPVVERLRKLKTGRQTLQKQLMWKTSKI